MTDSGAFVEAFFDYSMNLTTNFNWGLWAKAAYLTSEGKVDGLATDPPFDPDDEFGGNAHVSRYSVSAGLSALLLF